MGNDNVILEQKMETITMAIWYYYGHDGQKHGPYSGGQLRQLVRDGKITPETVVETEDGKSAPAKGVKGLTFAETPPAPKQLFCTNCGNSVSEQAVACMSCGAKPVGHRKFCRHCAAALNPEQVICIKCGAKIISGTFSVLRSVGGGATAGTKSKVVAGLLGILLGGLGVHKFYMGSWGWGLLFIGNIFVILPITAVLTLTVVFAPLFMLSSTLAFAQSIIGFVEGIIYLVMSDEAFAAKYPPETQSAFRW